MMFFLIGPHRVPTHTLEMPPRSFLAYATTPKLVPSDTGTKLDGSCPRHDTLEVALWPVELSDAVGASAIEGTHRLALIVTVDILALDHHLKA